jgi:hypothetical protein
VETDGGTGSRPGAVSTARWRRLAGSAGIGVLAIVASWISRLPSAAVLPITIVLLGVIDIVSGVVAKGWAGSNSRWLLVGGCAMYVVMFWLHGLSLRVGQLSTITIGWVVMVTVANMTLDRFVYRVQFPIGKWLAAAAAVLLLVYLFAGRNESTT